MLLSSTGPARLLLAPDWDGYPEDVLVYLLAVAAACLYGVASVMQQRVAFDAPPGKSLRPALLLWLVRQPAWLTGIVVGWLGDALAASALAVGSVVVVQPLLVTRLLVALPLSAVLARQHLAARDWLGVLATAAGLGTFLAVGRPGTVPNPSGGLWTWVLAAAAAAVLTVALVGASRVVGPLSGAALLGTGAGVVFGLQAGLVGASVNRLQEDGLSGLLTAPTAYAVAVTAVVSSLLSQSAYEMAPLGASYPALASVEPLAGIGVGLGVLGGTLAGGVPATTAEVVALLVMTLGIITIARSPLVSRHSEAAWRRKQEEQAIHLEKEVAHLLDVLERQLPGATAERLRTGSSRLEDRLARLNQVNETAGTRARLAARTSREDPAHVALMEEWQRDRLHREATLQAHADRVLAAVERAVRDRGDAA